jgi:hypothetical protein
MDHREPKGGAPNQADHTHLAQPIPSKRPFEGESQFDDGNLSVKDKDQGWDYKWIGSLDWIDYRDL